MTSPEQRLTRPLKEIARVYLIDCPADHDLLDDDLEGRALARSLTLCRIPNRHWIAGSRESLRRILSEILPREVETDGRFPIIHIAGHGNDEGIGLPEPGQLVAWEELREMMAPSHVAADERALLCMSVCKGAHAMKMAFTEDEVPIFGAVVGSFDEPGYDETVVGFTTFYHRVFRDLNAPQAVEAMKQASGHQSFAIFHGKDLRAGYKDQLRRIFLRDLSERLGLTKP